MFRMQPSVDCMKQFCRRPVTPLEMTDGVMCAFTGHSTNHCNYDKMLSE